MRMPFSPRFVPFLLVLSAAGGCGKDRSLPAGKPLPPLPPFTDSVAEKLKSIPAEKDFLSGKPGPELEGAAQLAMMSDLRMAARGWRDLKAAWPRSAAALGPLLVSSKIPGEKKARALDWAAGMGGRAAVQLCRLALEGRPDQDVEPRRRAAALLGEIGGPAEVPVLVLRLKYEEYGDPYALAWTARSLALLKNLSGLPYLLRLLGRADLKEEAGRILVEILGMEGIPWKKGGTWADLEKKEPVEPDSFFRIASLSKPITAAAVFKLIEKGKFRLSTPVVSLLKVKPHLEKGAESDPRLRRITIRHLLNHTGGFDREASFDPMFKSVDIANALGVSPPAGPRAIIRYMWGRPLDFDPGERYAYSNFGYCVLGRVIEDVTGKSYEAFVREEILKPLGIHRMRIGCSLRSQRAPGEVLYYDPNGKLKPAVVGSIGKPVPAPYGSFYLESMDSHGGWLASAVDLARFAAAFHDRGNCPILSRRSIEAMFERPRGSAGYGKDGSPSPTYYACGWQVRPLERGGENEWHAGALPGTATLLVRRHDGVGWVVLFNRRNDPSGVFLVKLIDPLLHRAAEAQRPSRGCERWLCGRAGRRSLRRFRPGQLPRPSP